MPSCSFFFSAVRVQHVCRRLADRQVQVLRAAELGVCPTEASCTRCDFNSIIGPQQAALDDADSINLGTTGVCCVHDGSTIAVSQGLHP